MRLLSALKFDMLSLYRYRIVHAYLLLTIFYIFLLHMMPESGSATASILVIFTDPVVLGFYFIGGIILLEKSQNTFDSLFVTPFRMEEYIISKVGSLTLLTVVVCLSIIILTTGFKINIGTILLGAFLSAIFFTLFGLTLAVRAKTLNMYFMISSLYSIIFFLPILDYLNIFHTWLFYFIPSYATLILIEGGMLDISVWEMIYAVGMLVIWIGIAYIFAKHSFYKSIILHIGSDKK
ncbi:ABC transporter permease [Oceanobacillus oncorhynchi]|uniref:ABC transporter permease n=1 Tax=Oceanobacillus oncorhynchi TaxID=545501 RepID=UPI002115D9C5|nr:ABC transporter permease [Oceanobacillus oncorhynchi]UUI41725.1 ABC transporter permease [Oceanobacillus oncorhynchi]